MATMKETIRTMTRMTMTVVVAVVMVVTMMRMMVMTSWMEISMGARVVAEAEGIMKTATLAW